MTLKRRYQSLLKRMRGYGRLKISINLREIGEKHGMSTLKDISFYIFLIIGWKTISTCTEVLNMLGKYTSVR